MRILPLLLVSMAVAFPALAAAPTVSLEALTWTEVAAQQKAGTRRIIIPTGGTEQNGPHIAIGKHNWIVRDSAERIATALGDTLVAPVLAYVPEGNISPPQGHMRFPGTISLSEPHYAAVLEDTARSLKQGGFTRIYFLGDSGGNQAMQQKVAEKLTRAWRRDDIIVQNLDAYYVSNPAPDYAHGAVVDTSQILAVRPQAVRMKEIRHYTADDVVEKGVAGDPSGATAKKGRAWLDARIVAAIAQIRRAENQ